MRTLICLTLLSLGLLSVTANAQRLRAQQSEFVISLEPNYETLQLYYDGPRTFEPCNPWPVKLYQPRPFNLRGAIFDDKANEIGRYFARGVIRQSDGAHVADYALEIKSVGTIVFALDALPDVEAAELDGFIFSGLLRNTPYTLTIKPKLTTDCPWGMRWEAVLTIGEFNRQ